MTTRSAGADYQALAADYQVGDIVVPYGVSRDLAGRVVAVYPAIGMVDVEFSAGAKRYPVEDLQRFDEEGAVPPEDGYIPGGTNMVSVPGGPIAPLISEAMVERVARAHVKQGLYWAARDRQYRATTAELDSGNFSCPKCRQAALKKAIYRRMKGQSERLYGCPSCLFLIERSAILEAV